VGNAGPEEWSDVRITLGTAAGGRYLWRTERVAAGQRVDVPWTAFASSRGIIFDPMAGTAQTLQIQCVTPTGNGQAQVSAAQQARF
jgi:hypothetical protein